MVLLFLKSIVLDIVLTLSETPSGVELFRLTDYSHRLQPSDFRHQILGWLPAFPAKFKEALQFGVSDG